MYTFEIHIVIYKFALFFEYTYFLLEIVPVIAVVSTIYCIYLVKS